MKKLIKGSIILILLLWILANGCYAQGKIEIMADKQIRKKEEEISIKVRISDTQIAACTLEIYWDMENLEYLRGPENANYSNHRILYMWVSDNGEDKESLETEDFVFKVLQEENSNFRVLGEFYNAKGEKIEIESGSLELKVEKQETKVEELEQENGEVEANNTDLKILRLNREGISPDFQKEIKEYYFIADSSVNELEVTVIPENPYATVSVTGNQNLKMGENKIEIHVLAQDKSREAVYQIYVTKTQNVELANANLENLAVRQGMLIPEFDFNHTKYRVEVSSQTNQIDILAIPQREKAKTNIVGNEAIEVGDNMIQIQVLAEDGITHKKYEILVHRRNEQEELQYEQERESQAERLSVILEEIQNEEKRGDEAEKQNEAKVWIIIGIGACIILTGIIIYWIKKKK